MALKPGTAFAPYADLLPDLDMVLVMTVEPGFGGQSFLGDQMAKVREVREAVSRHGGEIWVQVDGGVSVDTIEQCAEAGANVFVAGSAVYGADDAAAAVDELRSPRDAAPPRLTAVLPAQGRSTRARAVPGGEGHGEVPAQPARPVRRHRAAGCVPRRAARTRRRLTARAWPPRGRRWPPRWPPHGTDRAAGPPRTGLPTGSGDGGILGARAPGSV